MSVDSPNYKQMLTETEQQISLIESDIICRPIYMRANNNGRVQIVFSERIVLEEYENLIEAIQESGALQV